MLRLLIILMPVISMNNDARERTRQIAVMLRQLADKYQGLSDGRIKKDSREAVEAVLLLKVVKRALQENWL